MWFLKSNDLFRYKCIWTGLRVQFLEKSVISELKWLNFFSCPAALSSIISGIPILPSVFHFYFYIGLLLRNMSFHPLIFYSFLMPEFTKNSSVQMIYISLRINELILAKSHDTGRSEQFKPKNLAFSPWITHVPIFPPSVVSKIGSLVSKHCSLWVSMFSRDSAHLGCQTCVLHVSYFKHTTNFQEFNF